MTICVKSKTKKVPLYFNSSDLSLFPILINFSRSFVSSLIRRAASCNFSCNISGELTSCFLNISEKILGKQISMRKRESSFHKLSVCYLIQLRKIPRLTFVLLEE